MLFPETYLSDTGIVRMKKRKEQDKEKCRGDDIQPYRMLVGYSSSKEIFPA